MTIAKKRNVPLLQKQNPSLTNRLSTKIHWGADVREALSAQVTIIPLYHRSYPRRLRQIGALWGVERAGAGAVLLGAVLLGAVLLGAVLALL
ncbi:MAG: hypothetical protein K0S79_1263 [Nitrospira sp.]|nr:hypothetical protein [Nitrospira sp.]